MLGTNVSFSFEIVQIGCELVQQTILASIEPIRTQNRLNIGEMGPDIRPNPTLPRLCTQNQFPARLF